MLRLTRPFRKCPHEGFRDQPVRSDVASATGTLVGGISRRVAARRYLRGLHGGGLRDPGFSRLCGTCRPASAGRRVWLPVGRTRLRPSRVIAPTGNRTNLRHFADDCRHGRRNGRWRRATLCADRQPRRLHGGDALCDRLALLPCQSSPPPCLVSPRLACPLRDIFPPACPPWKALP
jgi:hypothetical protein